MNNLINILPVIIITCMTINIILSVTIYCRMKKSDDFHDQLYREFDILKTELIEFEVSLNILKTELIEFEVSLNILKTNIKEYKGEIK